MNKTVVWLVDRSKEKKLSNLVSKKCKTFYDKLKNERDIRELIGIPLDVGNISIEWKSAGVTVKEVKE
jgi:hypothetical protein